MTSVSPVCSILGESGLSVVNGGYAASGLSWRSEEGVIMEGVVVSLFLQGLSDSGAGGGGKLSLELTYFGLPHFYLIVKLLHIL